MGLMFYGLPDIAALLVTAVSHEDERLRLITFISLLPDNGKYPEMEVGLFQTGSSYSYAAEWVICEITTLKPMFSRSPNLKQ